MALSEADLRWMRHAIRLARRGFPVPNPHVGAVIVKDGVLLGEGYHPYAGAPHAEIFALQKAGDAAQGATMYVTLEPCTHYGRTPPCTNAIINQHIRRVVVGMTDPNSWVSGKGVQRLQEAGIQVELLSPDRPAEIKLLQQLETINRIYLYWRRRGRPFITLKAAMSMDGKIATHTGDSKWITSERARHYAHRLRAEHAAVLVGVETVLKDRPRLTARLPGVVNQPLRVVLDSRLRIVEALTSLSPLRSETGEANTLLSHAVGEENKGGKGNTLIFHLAPLDERLRAKIEKLQSWGFEMVGISPDPNQPDRVPVQGVVETLAERGISSILVEGGGQVAASFLEAKLVNRVAYFYAPKLIGGAVARTALEGLGVAKVADAPRVSNVSLRKLGEDWLVEGDVEYP